MRKLDLSSVGSGNRFPLKRGTMNFIQDSYAEIFQVLIERYIGGAYAAYVPYIIYGCKVSVGGVNTTITQGAIFWNGEIFLCPSQTIASPSGGNVVIANILTTPYTGNGVDADIVNFTDGTPRNVHNIRTMQIATGATGTGDFGDMTGSSVAFVKLGDWVDAGTPTIFAQTGTVTINPGDVYINSYIIDGDLIHWQLTANISLSASTASIGIVIPSSITSNYHFKFAGATIGYLGSDVIKIVYGSTYLGPNDSYCGVTKLDGTNIASGTKVISFTITTKLIDN